MRKPVRKKALTFIEIMFVVVIIGILASVLIGNFGNQADTARKSATVASLTKVESALELYKLHVGSYPDSLEELIYNTNQFEEWNGPYLKRPAKDGWSMAFFYRIPPDRGFDFDLWSGGADRESGTDDDIVTWINRDA